MPIVNLIFFVLSLLGAILYLRELDWFLQVLAYFTTSAVTVSVFVFYFLGKEKLTKSLFSINGLITFIIACFVVLSATGLFHNLSDANKVKQIIIDSGKLGELIYFLVILFQVVILPAPALLFYLLGTAIYGAFKAFLICYIATVLGSVISYFIGKGLGRRVVCWCIGKETTEKYEKKLRKKGSLLFAIMELLPFFPDDSLCMLAGLVNIKFTTFLSIIVFIRPIYIFICCFLGTGDIIPFTGWGIPVWIGIIIFFGVIFLLYCKNQDKIEIYIKNNIIRKRRKNHE